MLTRRPGALRPEDAHPRRPGPGARHTTAAHERAASAQGRSTVGKLLAAGLAEFTERGYLAVTVDDIARRARTSHGTFYLYFANKEDFFWLLARDALAAMESIASDFPVVSGSEAGRAALRGWVASFCRTYAAHATVFKILAQDGQPGLGAWMNGLGLLNRLASTISLGMTAGRGAGQPPGQAGAAHLDAIACLLMLERVNYLLSAGLDLPRDQVVDRLTAIMYAAFHPAWGPVGRPAPGRGDAGQAVNAGPSGGRLGRRRGPGQP